MRMQFIIQAVVFVLISGTIMTYNPNTTGIAAGLLALVGTAFICVVIPNALVSLWRWSYRLLGGRIEE